MSLGWLTVVLSAALLASGCYVWLLLRRATAAGRTARTESSQLREQVDQALARIERLTSTQGRFVGTIAHELKTPLAAAAAQAHLLLSLCEDPAAVRRYAKSIGEDMQHLSDMVESFLRLARPFALEDTSQHVECYFHDAVVEAVRRSQSLAREYGVSVVATVAETDAGDAAVQVRGDPVLLEAMVENLLRNAIRFSPRDATVDVAVDVVSGWIVLFVRDRGSGIAVEHHAAVFDWFFDMPAQARRSSGTGFGLAIARRVAEHHRGTIALRNRATGGSEFEVRLPCSQPSPGTNVA